LKVALVSSGSGSRGGGEIYLELLAEGLASLGCTIEAIVPEHSRMDELTENLSFHANIHRVPFVATYDRRARVLGAIADMGQRERMARFFRQLRPDILHVNQQVAEDGVDLLFAAKKSKLPWVSTIHVGRSAEELGAFAGSLRDWLSSQVLHRARGSHIAVSARSREQLIARFPHASARFRAVHNGTPVPELAELERERKRVRQEWGVTDDQIVVGSVGRIEAQKNPTLFVDCVAQLQGSDRIQCVWIGDGSLRNTMAARARDVGVHLHIDGWRPDADRRLAGFDIFFLPSLFEGLPFAVLEAMHGGLAIVASHSDGMGEAIIDGASGFLCNDEVQFVKRLQLLVEDKDLRLRLGNSARSEARAKFSLDAMARNTLGVYQEVLGQHAAA
jgi:glycosyltransferase involved in cell wall biosynthesis